MEKQYQEWLDRQRFKRAAIAQHGDYQHRRLDCPICCTKTLVFVKHGDSWLEYVCEQCGYIYMPEVYITKINSQRKMKG